MSEIFFAANPSSKQIGDLATLPGPVRPSVLISFFYRKGIEMPGSMDRFKGHRLMLDSGAFSAYKSKKHIDIDALIEESKKPLWNETVGLDVIGDPWASLKNAKYMKAKGSPAMPVFHIGDPWEILAEYCNTFDKVGLSCRFGEAVEESIAFYNECFARNWPHKFHSFGWTQESMLMRFPFHSADASSWELGPRAFGVWRSLNILGRGKGHKIESQKHSLHSEIKLYMTMQAKLKLRWREEWKKQKW